MYPTDHPHLPHPHQHPHHGGRGQDAPAVRGRRGRPGGFGRRGFGPAGPASARFGRPDLRSSGLGRSVGALLSAVRASAHAEPAQQARIEAILDSARTAVFSVLAEPVADDRAATDPQAEG